MSIKIVTDSTCDLPREIISKMGISVIPFYIHIGNKSYLDGIDISRDTFYKNLPVFSPFPTTATPGLETFRSLYENLHQLGATHILSIHISNKLSATVDIAQQAAQMTSSLPVTVIDSGQISLGTGFLVQTAAEMAMKEEPLQNILSTLELQISRTRVFAALDTLEFLRRSGRMNGAIAGLGSLLQIKPILFMHNGIPTSEKIRSKKRAMARIIKMLETFAPYEKLALVHSHAPNEIQYLSKKAMMYMPENEILTVEITPAIGAHIGPGAIGFACLSK